MGKGVAGHAAMAGLMAVMMLLLAGCAHEKSVSRAGADGPPFSVDADYERLAAQGKRVFRIIPGESSMLMVVRRAGTLARLGHDHVISSSELNGYVAPADARADLYIDLNTLVVDDPELRARAGLDTQPSASDIVSTRNNMLASLDAGRFPHIRVSVTDITPDGLMVDITLHGVTRRNLAVPAVLAKTDNALTASGQLAVNQSDFGIVPFSILGGAIRVQDRVELSFRISAKALK